MLMNQVHCPLEQLQELVLPSDPSADHDHLPITRRQRRDDGAIDRLVPFVEGHQAHDCVQAGLVEAGLLGVEGQP